jgi:hypothetical protein
MRYCLRPWNVVIADTRDTIRLAGSTARLSPDNARIYTLPSLVRW